MDEREWEETFGEIVGADSKEGTVTVTVPTGVSGVMILDECRISFWRYRGQAANAGHVAQQAKGCHLTA